MEELVVERPAMVEEQQKAFGKNGNKLHQETENEKGAVVVEEDDGYATFVLGEAKMSGGESGQQGEGWNMKVWYLAW